MTPLEQLLADFPCYANARCGVDVGDGWVPILRALAPILIEHGVTVSQVKEKFGLLSVYQHSIEWTGDWVSFTAHPVNAAISLAEYVADHTCEFCGSTDDVKKAGRWIKTVCGKCRAEKLDADGRWTR